MTKILKINEKDPEQDKIRLAAQVLRESGTVAFPTETVYGLGTNALNEDAVKKIFEAKGRPADNPLIIHIAEYEEINNLVWGISEQTKRLTDKFWPGPLTVILKKKDIVPKIITAGLDTVAIRFPSHPIAQSLIREAGIPIAAPSANTSGKPSPTTAQHVIDDLLGKVDVIIDGGSTEVGLESTVVDMSGECPILLRPGGITYEQLRDVLGEVQVDPAVLSQLHENSIPRSPGMKYKHYSPNADVIIIEGEEEKVIHKIQEMVEEYRKRGLKVGVMAVHETASFFNADCVLSVGSKKSPETIAANLFATLREFDQLGMEVVFAQSVDQKGIGMAVKNRLNKAAGFNIIKA